MLVVDVKLTMLLLASMTSSNPLSLLSTKQTPGAHITHKLCTHTSTRQPIVKN